MAAVQAAAEKLNIDVLNTRYVPRNLFYIWDVCLQLYSVIKTGPTDFTLLVASVDQSSSTHEFDVGNDKGKLTVQYGDYSDDLVKVNAALKKVHNRSNFFYAFEY